MRDERVTLRRDVWSREGWELVSAGSVGSDVTMCFKRAAP